MVTRRTVLKWSGAAGMMAVAGPLAACAPTEVPPGSGANADGLILPPGFASRIIARGGQPVAGTNHTFGIFPDGAATFADAAVPGGWYYTVNHEVPFAGGGVSSIRFAPDGTISDAYFIASETTLNCAGGRTPWGTWLTGEEFEGGRIWECDPEVAGSAVPRPALGVFQHEAAAVAADGRIYLTEDRPDGAFYRFTPTSPGDLSSGLLELATGTAPGPVTWVAVPDPSAGSTFTRRQVPGTMEFDGGEGVDTSGQFVWFTTKGDNRVWQYDTSTAVVSLRYQAGGSSTLAGVDNLLVDRNGAPEGTVLVAEDGDDMQVVLLRPDNTLAVVAQVAGHEGSEITGPTFSPDGQRLYFSSQRGPVGPAGFVGALVGVTYEVTGPFDSLLGR